MLSKPLPPNFRIATFVSLVRASCMLCNFVMNENEMFCPSEPANESSIFMEGGFARSNADPENVGIFMFQMLSMFQVKE